MLFRSSFTGFPGSAAIPVMNGGTATALVDQSTVTWTDNVVRFLLAIPAADDTPLFVQQRGEGHPLILLHGLGSHSGWLDADLHHLAGTRRVIAPDSRGHGRSGRPANFTLADHVSDVLAVMDALGIPQADVMGTSMGSYVVQALATTHPDRVSRLILVVPKASGQTSGTAALMARHEHELRDLTPQEAQAFLLERMFAPGTPQAIRAEVARRTADDHAAGQIGRAHV